ncbi:hypothetical protein D3C87_2180450 [compost metagenome]
MHRMFGIHRLDQTEVYAPVRIIGVHIDFLADDPLFLLHIFIREIRALHEIN